MTTTMAPSAIHEAGEEVEVEESEYVRQSFIPHSASTAAVVLPLQISVVHEGLENPVYAPDVDVLGLSPHLFSVAALPTVVDPATSATAAGVGVPIYALPASVASPDGLGSYCPSVGLSWEAPAASSLAAGPSPSAGEWCDAFGDRPTGFVLVIG